MGSRSAAAHPGLLSKGCTSMKPRYGSEGEARNAAIVASRRARVDLSYYECAECGGFHLTRSVGGANPRLPRGGR